MTPMLIDTQALIWFIEDDPFDRLIAAQCLRYDLTLVSIDEQFDAYGVRRIW